jgi:hypothetical protein
MTAVATPDPDSFGVRLRVKWLFFELRVMFQRRINQSLTARVTTRIGQNIIFRFELRFVVKASAFRRPNDDLGKKPEGFTTNQRFLV